MEKYCTAGQITDNNMIRRMRIACWIPKATNTHSEYLIHIAFPLQHWLHERAYVLRYTCNASLVTWWHRRDVYVAMFFICIVANSAFLGKLVIVFSITLTLLPEAFIL